jgi:hypothetical protein
MPVVDIVRLRASFLRRMRRRAVHDAAAVAHDFSVDDLQRELCAAAADAALFRGEWSSGAAGSSPSCGRPYGIARIPRNRPTYRALSAAQLVRRGMGRRDNKGTIMLGTILLIILILLVIGALPSWPYSSGWGYYPSGGLGLVLIIVLILVLMGRV